MNIRSVTLLGVVLLLTGCGEGAQEQPTALDDASIEANNRAVGLMGQYRNEDARQIFARLAEAHPELALLRSNEAVATLNRQNEGDEERALQIATATLASFPEHLPARYVAGLAELYLGRAEPAVDHLLAVAEADPSDAHASYFAAQALSQIGRSDEALALYRQSIKSDPYLRSAYYGAALLLRGQQDGDGARAMLADYQKLQGNPRAHLAEFRYTRMGSKAEAKVIGTTTTAAVQRPDGPLFAEPEFLATLASSAATLSLSTADIDGDGLQDLLLSASDAGLQRGWSGGPDGYQPLSLPESLTDIALGAAAWGDLDNDGQLDVVFCEPGGAHLRTVDSPAQWPLRSESAQMTEVGACADVQLFDADHDGDLDVYLLGGAGAVTDLLSNNLDGSLRSLASEEALLGGPASGSRQLLIADIDADRDLDLLLLAVNGAPMLLRNDRLWRYVEQPLPADWTRPWLAATVIDNDAQGRPSIILIDDGGVLWRGDALSGELQEIARSDIAIGNPQLLAQDFDGDGSAELLVWASGGIELLQQGADGLWSSQWRSSLPTRAVLSLLRTPAQGPELLAVVEHEGELQLARFGAGSGRFPFVAIDPSGRTDGADGMRSNASGIGTQLRLRSGSHWSLLDQLDRDSSPGQSLQPVSVGTGGRQFAEFVELQWSDGVMQTELALKAGELHRITEEQRQLASCPVLFAWNGERFGFVSDLLGVGGIGFLLAPGQYAQSRPWEFFRLPTGALVAEDGHYRLKIAEPMEETAYLDSARLHVYDLPDGWDLALDERMHTGGGPAPTGEPRFYRRSNEVALKDIIDQHDSSQLATLQVGDGNAVDPGARDPRFLGRLQQSMSLTAVPDAALSADADYLLIGEGWVEYPYSQTLFAAWQADADYRSFDLELRDAAGQWHMAYPQFGYPAGMPREFSVPLPSPLPMDDVSALRISSNLEVYLDRLRLVRTEPAPAELHHQALPPLAATLRRVGFPKRLTHAMKRPDFDYSERSAFWDTRYQEGQYTALGPALELVQEQDDGFAIIGPGDEIGLSFAAPPEPPPGFHRVLVLEVRGYAKDMDLYTRDGGSVGPLPITASTVDPARGQALNERYNQRFQGGR